MTNQTNDTKSSANFVFRKEIQCEGKRFFDSELKAQRAAHALSKHKKGTRKVEYYMCPHCEYWHVGKMPVYYRLWGGHESKE